MIHGWGHSKKMRKFIVINKKLGENGRMDSGI